MKKFYIITCFIFLCSCITDVHIYTNGKYKILRYIDAPHQAYVDKTGLVHFRKIIRDTVSNFVIQQSYGINENMGWMDFNRKKTTITYDSSGKILVKEILILTHDKNNSIRIVKSYRKNFLHNWGKLDFMEMDTLLTTLKKL